MDRRGLLTRGIALVTIGLAGCSGNDGEASPTRSPTEGMATSRPTASATATMESTQSPTPGGKEGTETAAAASETATASATASPSPTASPMPSPTATPGIQADQEVEVGSGGLNFSPDSFEITVGDTVLWTWAGSGHNVRPNQIPEASDWTGTDGGDDTTYASGHTHTYTFEVAGSYSYYCAPHRSAGMTGSFEVVE